MLIEFNELLMGADVEEMCEDVAQQMKLLRVKEKCEALGWAPVTKLRMPGEETENQRAQGSNDKHVKGGIVAWAEAGGTPAFKGSLGST